MLAHLLNAQVIKTSLSIHFLSFCILLCLHGITLNAGGQNSVKNLKTLQVAQWFETIEENATPQTFLYVTFCP